MFLIAAIMYSGIPIFWRLLNRISLLIVLKAALKSMKAQ